MAEDGGCEHVEADINLAHAIHREHDSFGTVGSCLVCAECDKNAKEEEDDEEHVCHDCSQTVKKKDGIEWKWYDFYPAQGDEALFICNCCKEKTKHLNRVAKDKADRNAEFGD